MKRALIIALVVACGSSEPEVATDKPIEPGKDAIVKTIDRGPAKFTLAVWPPKPTLADPIYVRLVYDAPAGMKIDAPFQQAGDDTLGRFKVVAFTRDTPTTQTYTLSAPTSGRYRVPPLRLEMTDTRGGDAKAEEILTDEVPIEIAPISTEAIGKPLAPALGSLDESIGGRDWMIIGAFALGGLIVGSGLLLLTRSLRAKRRIQKQRSAYDEAVARLRDLETRGAPGADDADAWFVDLSSIVRTYLEGRYEIRAPELTTEEFLLLVASSGHAKLTPDHRALLGGFLERCDRVKFAGYRPESSESIASLASARGFVEDTRLAPVEAS